MISEDGILTGSDCYIYSCTLLTAV